MTFCKDRGKMDELAWKMSWMHMTRKSEDISQLVRRLGHQRLRKLMSYQRDE